MSIEIVGCTASCLAGIVLIVLGSFVSKKNRNQKPKRKNTAAYITVGVGFLLLLIGAFPLSDLIEESYFTVGFATVIPLVALIVAIMVAIQDRHKIGKYGWLLWVAVVLLIIYVMVAVHLRSGIWGIKINLPIGYP
ncbi:MAG: hypothetical protein ABII72_03835 [Parcubacteria group bacterium]